MYITSDHGLSAVYPYVDVTIATHPLPCAPLFRGTARHRSTAELAAPRRRGAAAAPPGGGVALGIGNSWGFNGILVGFNGI